MKGMRYKERLYWIECIPWVCKQKFGKVTKNCNWITQWSRVLEACRSSASLKNFLCSEKPVTCYSEVDKSSSCSPMLFL